MSRSRRSSIITGSSPREMLDGLGMAETTPGPLIMVLQFVGFMAAYRDPGTLPPMLAGTLGGLLATWVTFTPCFLSRPGEARQRPFPRHTPEVLWQLAMSGQRMPAALPAVQRRNQQHDNQHHGMPPGSERPRSGRGGVNFGGFCASEAKLTPSYNGDAF